MKRVILSALFTLISIGLAFSQENAIIHQESYENWMSAVEEMAGWYFEKVDTYNIQRPYFRCELLTDNCEGDSVRADCSGFVSACLKLYGLYTGDNVGWKSWDFRDTTYQSTLDAYLMQEFEPIRLDSVWQDSINYNRFCPGDILCGVVVHNNDSEIEITDHGHVTIFAGMKDEQAYFWDWGGHAYMANSEPISGSWNSETPYMYNHIYDMLWRMKSSPINSGITELKIKEESKKSKYYYNVSGIKVSEPHKGQLLIHDGKKVFITNARNQ